MALLEIDDLTVRFGGVVALANVSFEVGEKEFVSIIGPNGAGKTTLFNVIAGVVSATSGAVRFKGRPIRGRGPARMSHIGVRRTFQVARPFTSMTVAENIRMSLPSRHTLYSWRALKLRERDGQYATRVDELLELTGLREFADTKASQLNMGGLRRLEIARALAGNPDVLLLDEPSAGIGTDGIRPLANLIRSVRERGVTILLVEHYVGLALSLCDRVVVLDEGGLIASGKPEAIRQDERVISAYLGTSMATG
jgi:ABC-type branched-subunit amino acid transport system ATPase component